MLMEEDYQDDRIVLFMRLLQYSNRIVEIPDLKIPENYVSLLVYETMIVKSGILISSG